MSDPVVIIGAGLAGLTCAYRLQQQNIDSIILEKSDRVGGRVATDEMDGYLLDRGFQVFLTAYPEAQSILDYEELDLKSFDPGALIRVNGTFQKLSDPWKRPLDLMTTAFARVGTISDKLLISKLRALSTKGSVEDLFERTDISTSEELKRLGFSDRMINHFFRPFLGGVFLDSQLETSARMLYFVFRMFSQGQATLPARGMQRIPEQIGRHLPEDSIQLGTTVDRIEGKNVVLADGKRISSRCVVVATEQPAAEAFLPELQSKRKPRSVTCLYFSAEKPPVQEPILVLYGEKSGLINNLCVPSQVSAEYAPAGQSLISVTVLDAPENNNELLRDVQIKLAEWFGSVVVHWKHLRTYRIPYALPNFTAPAFNPPQQPVKLRDDILVSGDYRVNGSINGAMQSGRMTAEHILHEIL
ncbi:NAD(P)/FAD-dependent oxidoreductase [Rubinisphaera italica]|uniref:Protoporphyrinogen oxidase n=1 Tax=Rubinisphaera italica TaxID=2527969 RepID=A0A5C5WYC6_9PLAN|nr:NAD(P)/FAD-dependent oxidoreductase [Rubinisphaera italica]TWT55686.1 Protoporphyrinogen oxidase [Rubinisphaera italica]